MRTGKFRGWLAAFGLLIAPAAGAWGQGIEVERSRSVTGPGGRTIEWNLEIERGPNGVSRRTQIRRAGGTYEREVSVQRAPGGWGPPPMAGRRPVVIERDVYVGRRGGGFGPGFVAAPFVNLWFGAPPPPPVVVYPEPVIVAPPPPPVVTYIPPQRYQPPAPSAPAEVVIDPVAEAIARLSSRHDNSRAEGARVLGRLGDPRALPALLDRLRADEDPDVRRAAATALGEIGDPRARVFLERSSVYDKKKDVRRAAAIAAARIVPADHFVSEPAADSHLEPIGPASLDDLPEPLPDDVPPIPPDPDDR